ncbi:endonuclease III [Candidatus Woesearchaeota archaeon]|nr:endonuclease III [Candidatus Woesearchaeota archaeon]
MTIQKIISILRKKYAPIFFKDKVSPYYVLISCLMSLRTKDEVTYPRARALFKKADTPRKMLKLSVKEIEKLIYPVGFYRVKARRIKEVSRYLIEKHNSRVPDDFDELLKIKGVGRKTANIVITHAFSKPGIAVDTHVHRISNRIGIVKTKTPEQTEMSLMKIIPKKNWIVFNELLVRHGQNICKPISPFCSTCPIYKYCRRAGVIKSR